MRRLNGVYEIIHPKSGHGTWKWVFLGDPLPSTRKMNTTEYLFHGTDAQKESMEKQLIAEEKKHRRKLIRTKRIDGI